MSEAELHILSSRLQGAKLAAAERGDLRSPLPVGYVYDDEGECVIDPDMEVQAAIRDVFAAFAAGGSAYQVVAAFVGLRFPLRAYGGAWAGQLRWGKLTHARALGRRVGTKSRPAGGPPTATALRARAAVSEWNRRGHGMLPRAVSGCSVGVHVTRSHDRFRSRASHQQAWTQHCPGAFGHRAPAEGQATRGRTRVGRG